MKYRWKINGKANSIVDILKAIAEERKFSKEQIISFISQEQELHDPFLFRNMRPVVDRIKSAINNNEKICIVGDYDCDGVCSTYTLYTGLKYLHANVIYKLPHRIKNGYGLKRPLVDYAIENGSTLIITVDNGIAAIDAVNYAKEKGIDVIVTDHHDVQEELPDCLIINPKEDLNYPFQGLCGCGVAFKLLSALIDDFFNTDIYETLIEIVAIATVADAMELIDENRFILIEGLKRLQDTQNDGLRELFDIGNLSGKTITSSTIGFFIGPNINACGRVDSPDIALNMLLADDVVEANKFANKVVNLNSYRKELQLKALESLQVNEEDNVIVTIIDDKYAGIVGIIASNIVDKYHKPCFVFHGDKEIIGGSGRTFSDFEIINCVVKNKNIVEGGGGHKGACGVSIKSNRIEEFKVACNKLYDEWLKNNPQSSSPTLNATCEIPLELANMRLINNIKKLEPFGSGNPEPIFVSKNIDVLTSRVVGKSQNVIQFTFGDNNCSVKGIGFNSIKEKFEQEGSPMKVDIMYTVDINEWPANVFNPQLNIIDIVVSE